MSVIGCSRSNTRRSLRSALTMKCFFNGTLLTTILPPVLVTQFILGVLGNGFALWIFCFHLKPWKSSTVLLFNLAVADFLLMVALPFRASYYNSGLQWIFGETFCNICLFMLQLNRSGSSVFLMAIALDRYMRVVHPHHSVNYLSVGKSACGAVALWLLCASVNANIMALKQDGSYCESFLIDTSAKQTISWHTFIFIFSFWAPFAVIVLCTVRIIFHLRGRQLGQQAKIKKAIWLITAVCALFSICFLPSNITQIMIWIETKALAPLPDEEKCRALDPITNVFYVTIIFTYLNSALDPIVYYFSSPVFKNVLRRALRLPQAEPTESVEKKTRESNSQSLSQL